ncbi:MAG: formate dehydrogenase subunit delta [Hyphomicrobium sp.]
MHAKPSDKLVMMANQIAKNLEIQGQDRAVEEMSSHIRKYWEPRMRETMLAYVREDGSALNPLAMKSLQAIWPDLKPGMGNSQPVAAAPAVIANTASAGAKPSSKKPVQKSKK